jgi:hypothetical protein
MTEKKEAEMTRDRESKETSSLSMYSCVHACIPQRFSTRAWDSDTSKMNRCPSLQSLNYVGDERDVWINNSAHSVTEVSASIGTSEGEIQHTVCFLSGLWRDFFYWRGVLNLALCFLEL